MKYISLLFLLLSCSMLEPLPVPKSEPQRTRSDIRKEQIKRCTLDLMNQEVEALKAHTICDRIYGIPREY